MRKFRSLVGLLLGVLVLFSAMLTQGQDTEFVLADRIQAKVDAGETLNFYVSYQDVSNEFAPFIKAGVERAAEELGVNAQFIGPVGSDAESQVSEIETLLETADGFAISSVSTDALAPIIDRALAAGIPVVTYNTDNPESNRLAFAGQDLIQSGREAGILMGDILQSGKVIIITLDAAAQWSLDREQGVREALANYPDIEIVATINTGSEPSQIYSSVENAMLANPDVTGIVSLECCSTPAAGEYIERSGLSGQVKVVGFDLLDSTVALVESGVINATIDQAPERQGFEAVNMLVQFLAGNEISDIDTGVGIYTPDNIAEYIAMSSGEAVEGANVADFALAPRIAAKIAAGEQLNLYLSYPDVSNEFAPFVIEGVEQAAADFNVNVTVIGPVGPDADIQVNQIETLLETMDGLAIASVTTDALAPILNRALEMGIPVVTYNTDNPESNRLAFAGQDLVQSGYEAGILMGDVLGGEGKVIITTLNAAAQWSLDREEGARAGLATFPGIEVVATINTGTEPQQIYSSIENAMLANPDVTGILSLECCSTPSAGEWVERNGLTGQVYVVGFDLLDLTVELIEKGVITATIDQAPDRQGYEGVAMLVRFLNGETITNIDTGVKIYNSENIGELSQ